jgi:hypothetical protein
VTSDLDPETKRAEHRQGGGGVSTNRGGASNSNVLKILTSNL